MESARIDECIAFAAAKFGCSTLKKEQDQAIRAFVEGSDVFISLPTGYGKSLCFAMLPFVYDRLKRDIVSGSERCISSIVICVTPLQSLMMDQHERFSRVGLRVEVVGGCQDDEDALIRVRNGEAQLIYISPELLLTNLQWREMLRSEVYQENLVAFVVDEAHTVNKW